MTPVYKLSNAGGFTSKQRYTSMLAGNAVYEPVSFESIVTTTVGAGGAADVTFSSIPSTYTHLQIRLFAQTNRSTYNVDSVKLQVGNGSIDTGTNYSYHTIYSSQTSPGTSVNAAAATTTDIIVAGAISSSVATSVFGVSIIDILDYANTNKYKTIRCLSGSDTNGAASGYAGFIEMESGSWRSTSAIDRIKIAPVTGTLFTQYSHFALYGIKAA